MKKFIVFLSVLSPLLFSRNHVCSMSGKLVDDEYTSNHQGWEKVNELHFNIGNELKDLIATLYKGACDNKGNCHLLVIVEGNHKTLYRYDPTNSYSEDKFFSTKDLFVANVCNDVLPELIFYSQGPAGRKAVHVIKLLTANEGRYKGLADSSPESFYDVHWEKINGEIYGLSAQSEHNGVVQLIAYKWDSRGQNFIITNGLLGSSARSVTDQSFDSLIQEIKNCNKTQFLTTDATKIKFNPQIAQPIDLSQWKKVKDIDFKIGPNNITASMYKGSCKSDDCDLMVVAFRNNDLIYTYKSDPKETWYPIYFANDDLLAKDVTNDGVPELIFKTSFHSISGRDAIVSHIVGIQRTGDGSDVYNFTEIGLPNFNLVSWEVIDGITYAFIPNILSHRFDPYIPNQNCGSCSKPVQLIGYVWNAQKESFFMKYGMLADKFMSYYDLGSTKYEDLVARLKACK